MIVHSTTPLVFRVAGTSVPPYPGDPNVPQSRSCNQDQFEVLERHTQWGLDLLDKYVKFVKERVEVEQSYAKQLR